MSATEGSTPLRGSAAEVFATFLKLGLTSFGGPIAHIGYFHRELVSRRGWVDESQYAHLLALSQFLPGPASSQLGFSLGVIRAGWWGGVAAFIAFTLPSVSLLFAFAHAMPWLEHAYGQAATHGLKLVAVAVVAHGLLTMAQRLTPDTSRRLIAVAAAAAVIVSGTASMQVVVVAIGALLGLSFCRHVAAVNGTTFRVHYGNRTGVALLIAFAVLLGTAFIPDSSGLSLQSAAKAFYRAGALVFGGAHVVLPLLEESFVRPGFIGTDEFLAGYGAAQAVPGPMFSVSAYIGARIDGSYGGALGATVSAVAIFLPGLLLVAGTLPMWQWIASNKHAVSALAGVNAAVVGLLAAALYDPVGTSAILGPIDFAIASIGFALLATQRVSVLFVLAWCVLASMARLWLGG